MGTNKIKRTTTRVQFEEMVGMMKTHPDIARNNSKRNPETTQKFWENIRDKLNSLGPPIKEIADWKKVWSDLKCSLRKKLAHNKRETRSTGGGDYSQVSFSPLEEEVIELVCLRDCVEGVTNAKKFGVPRKRPFNSDDAEYESTENNLPTVTTKDIEESLLHEGAEIQIYDSIGMETPTEVVQNKGPKQLRLLEKQINIQEKWYNDIRELTKTIIAKFDEGNSNQKKIYRALDKISDHQKAIKQTMDDILQGNKRHHLKMEQLGFEKNKLKQQLLEIELKKQNYM